jgi:hypothetical protein
MNKGSASRRRKSSAIKTQCFSDEPPPRAVNAIFERKDILGEAYPEWVTHVAIINPKYAAYQAPLQTAKFTNNRWQLQTEASSVHFLDMGGYTLWVCRQSSGWTVVRNTTNKDSQLCTIFGEMPILCSSFETATELAAACNPRPMRDLDWRLVVNSLEVL